jgi:zinc protease
MTARRTVAYALLALIAAVVSRPAPISAEVFDPTTFTLDNGLQVVVVTNRRAPIVTQMLWYKVGAADDPRGRSGLAHVTEHLMFKGTPEHPDGEFSDIVARLGGSENAFTSYDYTGYYQTVAREHLERIMELEADRMQNLKLEASDVKTESQVVVQERKQRVDNSPDGQLSEMATASLFLHHPYGTPVIGWAQELKQITQTDAETFYDRWYAPNNAVLIIAGDVTTADVKPLAREHYGDIPRADVPDRRRVQEPAQTAPRRVSLESAQVNQPSLSIRYLAPSYRTAENRGTPYALQVLSELIGSGPTSRLYRELVVNQEIAVSAGSWYSPNRRDTTSFGLYVSPRPGTSIDKVETALRAEIADVLENGVSAEEVQEAKDRLRADVAYARDDITTAPRVLGRALVTGQSIADVESWPDRIAGVTVEEVEAAAKAVFRENSSVTSELKAKPAS